MLHQDMHRQGAFRKGHFDSLVRKCLRLYRSQYMALNQSIQSEKLRSMKTIPITRNVLACSRYLKVSTRPLVLAMSGSTALACHVRRAGEKVGYTYPQEPREVEMHGPTPVLDYLTPDSTSSFLPLPQLADPLDGVDGLDITARSMIQANLDTNRHSAGS